MFLFVTFDTFLKDNYRKCGLEIFFILQIGLKIICSIFFWGLDPVSTVCVSNVTPCKVHYRPLNRIQPSFWNTRDMYQWKRWLKFNTPSDEEYMLDTWFRNTWSCIVHAQLTHNLFSFISIFSHSSFTDS